MACIARLTALQGAAGNDPQRPANLHRAIACSFHFRPTIHMKNPYLSACLLSAAFVLNLASVSSQAADPANGQTLSRQCSVCHGKDGIANDPEVPSLAGQSSLYLEKSLKDFRDGIRQDRRMSLMAQNLTDEQIKDLAAWYSSFKVEVTMPE